MKTMHMISNAHIDPVWQWGWEEGVSAALSTFRAAAEFCENYDGYIFNHNEALLYEWVEEYEPELFKRIQKLVQEKKWHIMGGWYLQPDCVMPSGESFVRQILLGKKYFKEKFGVFPTTAVNFDSFGHTKGLVQIMVKSGFDSYVFMRPDKKGYELAKGINFIWEGFDGSQIICHKIMPGYNSLMGQVQNKINDALWFFKDKEVGLMPWGVGNHGGGASRADLATIEENQNKELEFEFIHSTPENYFKELAVLNPDLPVVKKSLIPIFVGCYTSQIRIKKKHRELENLLYSTEKMATAACLHNLMEYPEEKFHQAMKCLAFSEFHDILPGTSIQSSETDSLNMMGNAIYSLSEIRAKAFFALATGQEKAKDGEYPILAYNPHPFPVKGIFECEFMLADQNWLETFSMPEVYQDGVKLKSQVEKEGSTFNLDWRKKVSFEAVLEPASMSRFDCRIKMVDSKPTYTLNDINNKYIFENGDMTFVINKNTGLVDSYVVGGKEMLAHESFKFLVAEDIADSWRMDTNSFDKIIGEFKLMTEKEGATFCGIKEPGNIRVVNDGEVRTVVEAYFKYNASTLCLTYKIPKSGTGVQVDVRVYWNEKDKMLKLSIPTSLKGSKYVGQTAFGIDQLPTDGSEAVSHKWCAAVSAETALYVINDGTYGSSFENGEIRLSLVRSAGYCTHPIPARELIPEARFLPRFDQGEHFYSFWMNVCDAYALENADRDAMIHNEKPYVLNYFPSGEGEKTKSAIVLDCKNVGISAFKKTEKADGYILRVYENSGKEVNTYFEVESLGIKHEFKLSKFEVKTFLLKGNTVIETNLVENI